MGTCVVAMNVGDSEYWLAEINPHLVEFYRTIKAGYINSTNCGQYLQEAHKKLQTSGQEYDYEVRERFNDHCDQPYIDRYNDYNSWSDKDEIDLYHSLKDGMFRFFLSTWHPNDFRRNIYINRFWRDFSIVTKEHFYHLGANENNRHGMIEALVTNAPMFKTTIKKSENQLAFNFS